MKSKTVSVGLFALLICLLQAVPTFAATASVNGINSISVDCAGTVINLNVNVTVSATNADYNFGGTNYDLFELVLYDGANTAFAYKATLVTVGGSGSYNIAYNIFMNLPSYRPFTIRYFDLSAFPVDFAEAQAGPLLDEFTFDPNDYVIAPCTDLPLLSLPVVEPLADGRINYRDAGAPVIVYGHDGEKGRGLVLYSPQGVPLLQVTAEQIAAVADCPDTNTLIAKAGAIEVYRLSSCLYQVNALSLDGMKTYVLIFDQLTTQRGAYYLSYEQ